jgi:hypothetical protein
MTTATLTPQANQTPAVANVTKELSGEVWGGRFPASESTDTLTPAFKVCVDRFKAAIEAGGGHVDISNTYRSRQRAYMMHWCHKIFRNGFNPANVPYMPGVEIEWVHPTLAESVAAAQRMVIEFRIDQLAANVPPSLNSLHCSRQAVDMRIWWTGDLIMSNMDGTQVTINTLPRTGMNLQLKQVGQTYGVIKFVGGNADKPHWSTNGH